MLKDIDQHCTREFQGRYTDLSIGRGVIRISGITNPQRIWIVNREYERRTAAQVDINNTVKGTELMGL